MFECILLANDFRDYAMSKTENFYPWKTGNISHSEKGHWEGLAIAGAAYHARGNSLRIVIRLLSILI
jgi:hypothetical protein